MYVQITVLFIDCIRVTTSGMDRYYDYLLHSFTAYVVTFAYCRRQIELAA